eukprot:CAMPEP_0198286738 /NCGR_PEP_ID=MMETSP1449-20131203/5721_1 /TAXON_ID=420275 /ORGANISM="Attheya septentrionalis, Strain CCMP2084" /LENGTH=278 /DNA_ID=CAMNT_0043984523 /DNA_START=164 /DNA_END=997 /DNA_ORIENTATION=-
MAAAAMATTAGAGGESKEKEERMERTTLCFPIVYGSVAYFLGKKADEYHTHQWTLYVRGPNNEDLSVAIRKVVFQLHPSFPQPVRELTQPPYELTEKGWGEFEVTIRILWRDPNEKSIVLTHGIRLYPPGLTALSPNVTSTKEPVVHEFYDEVVFTDPAPSFHQKLMRQSTLPKVMSQEESVQSVLPTYTDESTMKALVEAQQFLGVELRTIKDRLMRAHDECEEAEEQLRAAAEAKAKASAAAKAAAASAATNVTSGNSNTKTSNTSKGKAGGASFK